MQPAPEQIEAVRLPVNLDGSEPVEFGRVAGRVGPVDLEIGCGKGAFLVEAARREPDVLFVGVEISRKYALKTAARIVRAGVRNARFVWMDSLSLLERAVPAASLRAIHVYFPDPWPKRRHHKRRVVNARFAAAAARALRPGGSLFFLTDDPEMHAHTVGVLARAGGLAPQPFDLDAPDRPRTGYEMKWRGENRTLRGGRWVRRGR